MKPSDLLHIPNLLSLLRIMFLPFIGYFIAQGDGASGLIALGLLILAGITDGLDGYFARRLNQVTQTGLILDPLADKILAAGLVILLIFYREFPIWLAVVIVGRDLLLLVAGLLLLRKSSDVPSSNITGKYAFFSIIVLLSSYIISFVFGIWLFSMITIVLIAVSVVLYARRLAAYKTGKVQTEFDDRFVWRALRFLAVTVICSVTLYNLYLHLRNFLSR